MTAPAVMLAGWLVAGFTLLLLDGLTPVPALVLGVGCVITLGAVAVRARPSSPRPANLPALAALLAVAGGFAALAWTTSAEDVIVRRDGAVYAQTTSWLGEEGRLPIPADSAAFGDAAGLAYGSPGFYQRDDPPELWPQFMTGTSIALTPAAWGGGLAGTTRGNAVVGALALLAVGGLAARLAGPWAGPLAALLSGLAFPVLHQARAAFSEPAAQLLLYGGLCLLADAARARRARGPAHALAGLVLGLGVLVRIDALTEIVPLIPLIGVLAVRGRTRDMNWLVGGLATGTAIGLADGLLLARPYLDMLAGDLALTGVASLGVLAATVLALRFRTRLRAPQWWPDAAAAGVVLLGVVAYAVRPYLSQPTFPSGEPVARDITALEARLGLPAIGRTYVDDAMRWPAWWLGLSGLTLGLIGLALMLRRGLRDPDDPALPFVVIALTGIGAFIAHPGITPDHPWADRRLVPVVLPALVVGAVWLLARVGAGWADSVRRRQAVAVVGVAVLVAPVAWASASLLGRRPYVGQLDAVRATCAALPANAAVVVAGDRAEDELPQVIRGSCDVPVAVAPLDEPAVAVAAAAAAARANGRRPVVVGMTREEVAAASGTAPRRVVLLSTTEDDRQLVQRPSRIRGVSFEIWTAEPR